MKIDPKWKELNSLSDNTGQGKLSIVVPSEINNIKILIRVKNMYTKN